MSIPRRTLISAVPVIALAACSAFTTTTKNGVTTTVVNVAQIDAWGQAIVNAARLVSTLPGIVGTAPGAAIAVAAGLASVDLAAFDKAAAGSLTLSFDANSVPASITSLLSDGSTVLADAKSALTSAVPAVVQTAQTYVDALQTIMSIFNAAVVTKVGAAPGPQPMSERDALKTLRVQ